MGHHYLPQRYLRNFEDPKHPGHIWLHDKRDGTSKRVPIDNVAQSSGYFSKEDEESLGEQVEKPANAVMQRLMSLTGISVEERLQLAFYVAVMWKRVPAGRKRVTAFIPDVVKQVMSDVRCGLSKIELKTAQQHELLSIRLRELEELEQNYQKQYPDFLVEQSLSPWPTPNMVAVVAMMTWRILVATDSECFLTTDNPVFFFDAYGLGNKNSELCFPFSSNHALHGCWQQIGRDLVFQQAEPKIVREINRRVSSQATRLGFFHEAAPWIVKLLRKEHPFLSAIKWKAAGPQ